MLGRLFRKHVFPDLQMVTNHYIPSLCSSTQLNGADLIDTSDTCLTEVFYCILLSCYVSLRSHFRVLMSVMIFAYKRCSFRLTFNCLLESLICLIYVMCVSLRIVVSNTY